MRISQLEKNMPLFIGGPMDGQHVNLQTRLHTVDVAIPQEFSFRQETNNEYKGIKKFTYKRETLACPGQDYDIYVPKNWDCDDLLTNLISGYRNNNWLP